jgi:polysaccharide biosynthesis transport protein
MQPSEGFSVTRRALDIEDYIDVVRRHKGWIFGPFLFTLVASVVGVMLWPDSYLSTGVIKIVPQQLPQNMVPTTVTQDMQERINSMANSILSRSTLTSIINTLGLYPRERNREPIEDVIDEMHNHIGILPVASVSGGRQVPAFAVQYSYENRFLAQKVVADLISRFIDENQRSRGNATFLSVQFFRDQVDEAQKKLDTVESKLVDFRIKNAGRLPDEMQGNIQQLQSLSITSTNLNGVIARAQADKLTLENDLRFSKDRLGQLAKETVESPYEIQRKSQKLAEIDTQIEQQQNLLAALKNKYRDSYPDVQTAAATLAILKQNRENVLKEEADSKKDATPAPKPVNQETVRETRDLEEKVSRLTSQIEAQDIAIDNANKELKKNGENMRAVEARISSAPPGEKEYDDLRRDRDLAKTAYEEMQAKLSTAQVGKDMEDRKQGELLEILDPASLPEHVASPNRYLVISMGAGAGLLLGIVIAGAREMKDTSLKNLKDVRAYTQMAILGSIPLLENDFVVRRRRRLAWLGWTTSCLAASVVMAGSVVYYFTTRQ